MESIWWGAFFWGASGSTPIIQIGLEFFCSKMGLLKFVWLKNGPAQIWLAQKWACSKLGWLKFGLAQIWVCSIRSTQIWAAQKRFDTVLIRSTSKHSVYYVFSQLSLLFLHSNAEMLYTYLLFAMFCSIFYQHNIPYAHQ